MGMGQTKIFLRRAAHVAVLALVAVPVAVVLAAPPAAARSEAGSAALARRMLAQLKVARALSIRGYSRDRFRPHWPDRKGRCSTRELVLARDGRRVRRNAACHPVRGVWHSPYDGKVLRSERLVDIDHVVPLAYAWRSGAKRWSPAKRRAFAGDLRRGELLTVSHSANIAKGGRGPQSWRPQRRAYWCRYATTWIGVKHHYRLFVTPKEKVALLNMLRTC
ncbi:HNH endonuclease family protein [Nonomuraea sp. MG754425]|uniref:HNH endonuclease family protein n=1 Tax=Nonomuraea sp. MG754425 TaxID=2570319 RepID=UPI001F39D251|nr:HNH endonuclease family protein [Nonomuraea sp. MG754425]